MSMLAAHPHGPADGLPLVLLHAFPLDARMYDRALSHLGDVPVLALDSPGFGDSPGPAEVADAVDWAGGPSLELVARAVLAALDARGVDRFVVAGTSIGGYVSMRLAALAPERLSGVGLLDTKAAPDTDEARARRERLAADVLGPAGVSAVMPTLGGLLGPTTADRSPELVDLVAQWAGEATPDGVAFAARAMAERPDSLADLRALGERGVPALVLRGVEDGLASDDDALDMAEALRTEVLEVDGVGHLAPLEDPEAVGRALRDLHERAATAAA
ncbi:alpha/beta fold hydrolase [Georgenia sp. Z1344]|uniref:alpha/beta fold hydrolase n=1 Tax=Georgenia sp. Z1344 TaxID=3416706 RepID=UPI003CE86B5D